MSVRVTNFAAEWVAQNIAADAYEPDDAILSQHVEQLKADAEEAGIGEDELREDLGDLTSFVSDAMEAATDDEV